MHSAWPSNTRSHGRGVLVPELLRTVDEPEERSPGRLVRIGPRPVLGHRCERLVEDTPVHRRLLERERPFGHRRRRRQPQERLRREARHQDVCGERFVTQLCRDGECQVRVLDRPVEALEDPDAARRHALMGGRKRLAVVAGLVDDLREQLARLGRCLVQANARKDDERSRAQRAGLQRGDQLVEPRLRSPRVSGLEVEIRGRDPPTDGLVSLVRRRELARSVEEQCRRTQRAASTSVVGGVDEDLGDFRLRLGDARGELPRTRLQVFEQFREARMHRTSTQWVGDLVRARCQERMREADPLSVELHQPRLERWGKARVARYP